LGDGFSVADAYLFVVMSWAAYVQFDLSPYTNLLAYQQRLAERPSIQAALRTEGLKK